MPPKVLTFHSFFSQPSFLLLSSWRLLLMISSTTRESVPGATKKEEEEFAALRPREVALALDLSCFFGCRCESLLLPHSSSSFYAPFGAGPHICLGMGLALQELRAVLALIVRDYDWEILVKDERWDPPMLPEEGLPVLFWRRSEGAKGRERAREAARAKGWVEEEEEEREAVAA